MSYPSVQPPSEAVTTEPAAAAQAPAAGSPAASPTVGIRVPGAEATATEIYHGLEAQRDELRDQLGNLEEKRSEITRELRRGQETPMSDAVRQGLEGRLAAIDARIVAMDAEIAMADAAVARAAAVPGVVVREPPTIIQRSGPDEDVVAIGLFFTTIILMPIVIAYSRRLWRKGAVAVSAIPAELMQRFARMEQGVDAMAIEVERISEGQRFMTRLFTESGAQPRALGAQVRVSEAGDDARR